MRRAGAVAYRHSTEDLDESDRFPGWRRNAFVGGMREGEVAPTGQLQRIVFNDKWEELRRESLLRELHQRIRCGRVPTACCIC